MTFSDFLYPGLLTVSFILMIVSAWQYSNTKRLLENGLVVNGKVIDLIESRDGDGVTYKPVFEFTDRSNKKITFKASFSSSPATHSVGDDVKIVYSTTNDTRKIISY